MTVFPLVISWFLTFGYVPEMTDSVNGRSTEIDNNRIATVAQIGLSASTDDELFTVYTDMQNFQLVIACLLEARSACPETQKRQPPKPPEYIATILRNAEIQHNLPIGLAVCIAWHESSYKPTALSRCVGGYRSRGLMQIYHVGMWWIRTIPSEGKKMTDNMEQEQLWD